MKLNKKILVVGLGMYFVSCNEEGQVKSDSNAATELVKEELQIEESLTFNVDAAAFDQKLAEMNGVLVDVRTPEEYADGFIEGAINIDFTAGDFEAKISELDKSKPTFVYCMHGGRSSNAMAKMNELGFTEVYNLLGGYAGYTENQ